MDLQFSHPSRVNLIQSLTQSHETDDAAVRVIAHAVCDDVLWSVTEITALTDGAAGGLFMGESVRYIRCDLLPEGRTAWAHVSMLEAEHPFIHSCPLAFLDLASEQSSAWRQRVRAHHARSMLPTLTRYH